MSYHDDKMKCPNCGIIDHNNRVVDSRAWKHTIRRKRKCNSCNHKWNTFEAIEEEYITDRTGKKYLPWTPGEEETLVHLREAGLNYKKIGEKLGRNRNAVSRKVNKLMESGEYFIILDEMVKERVQ